MKYTFLLFFISGCGFHISSDPVQVNHSLNLNFEQIALYCKDFCTNDPDPSSCESSCFTNILNSIIGGIQQ